MSPRAACQITMTFPPRVAVEAVVILPIVEAAFAIFIDPGVGGSASNLAGQGKAQYENDDPRHGWPSASPYVPPKNRPSPPQVPYASGTYLSPQLLADPYA